MADTAQILFETPELVEKAKAEFLRRTKGKKYVCPIPPEVMPAARRN